MRYITERELRAQFEGGAPASYTLPEGALLTPAAREYLQDLRLFSRGVGVAVPKESTGEKPEHMTHLDGRQMVPKDHPRIVLRGLLDRLEAEILLVQTACARLGRSEFVPRLQDALNLTRRVLASDVTGMALDDWTLDGMNEEEVRAASHDPKRYTGGGHVLPDWSQGELPALLNCLRTYVRQAEVQAVAAFGGAQPGEARVDLIRALNRLSSYFYVLELAAIYGEGAQNG